MEEEDKAKEQLRLVTDALPVLISYVDSEQRYRLNNRAYEEWFGRSRTEMLGKHIKEVLGESAYEAILKYIEAALSGEKVTFEGAVPYKDGGTRYISATYIPHFGEKGEVKGFFALVNDITDRKQWEEELRRAHDQLEMRVQKRTAQLTELNEKLRREIAERKRVEE
ncbi:MAG: PAS domain-containing protein, partial [Dehalococcoidales bacterium]